MPPLAQAVPQVDEVRSELQAVLQSDLFQRAPALAKLLAYVCDKALTGRTDQIKEYTLAVEVFGRNADYEQESDSIVRVEANRLRKRLDQFYAGPGANHRVRISVPVGQYVPVFEYGAAPVAAPTAASAVPPAPVAAPAAPVTAWRRPRTIVAGLIAVIVLVGAAILMYELGRRRQSAPVAPAEEDRDAIAIPTSSGIPVGDAVRILAGSARPYVDRAGRSWTPDQFYSGGASVRGGAGLIWRTQDPELFRSSRQGDFAYDIPLHPGVYELHLFFAETFYGPGKEGGGGEGTRVMSVTANGKPLLPSFDVLSDTAGSDTADVKVFTGIQPDRDGLLHLKFASVHGGRAMVSAIEIIPGLRDRMRPVRLVMRNQPYYSNDGRWWSHDMYFRGGQLADRPGAISGTDDPELFESERWGNFSYAIPVAPGRYTVTLYFVERVFGPSNRQQDGGTEAAGGTGARLFNVSCNGRLLLETFDVFKEAGGENRLLSRKFSGLEPNAQGNIQLEFVPVKHYATVAAIEVAAE